jgi:hypothetical protein
MLNCFFMKRKLYEYLDGGLSDKQKAGVKKHLEKCVSCSRLLNEMKSIFDLAPKGEINPSQNFWDNFKIGLDRKLNDALLSPLSAKPGVSRQLKPVLAYAIILTLFFTAGGYFYRIFSSKHAALLAEQELVEEVLLLDEVDSASELNHSEDAYIEELDILYSLNHA